MDSTAPKHPISYAAKRTGLSTHVIRVWERRHGAVKPGRTETRRRLYSDADIERLRLLAFLTRSGHTIQHLAPLDTGDLRKLARETKEPAPPAVEGEGPSETTLGRLMLELQQTAEAFDAEGLNVALQKARLELPLLTVLEELIAPFLTWVGDQWHAGTLRVGQEHAASATVRGFLMRARRGLHTDPGAPRLLVGTPAGEFHEIGALLVSVAAAEAGWRDVYLGPNSPAPELVHAALTVNARAIALSLAAEGSVPFLEELRELRQLAGPAMPILAGGVGTYRVAHHLSEIGVRHIPTLRALQDTLRSL